MDSRPHLTACEKYAPENQGARPPKGFAVDPEVSPDLKGLMLAVCWFLDPRTGLGFPTYRELHRATGLHKNTLRRWCRHIAALGWLDIEQRTGSGLALRLRGGVNRMQFSAEKMNGGGTTAEVPGGYQNSGTGGVPRLRYPDDLLIDDLIDETVLKKNYGLGAADAAAVAASMPPERLRQLLAYVDANPPTHPDRYILVAAEKERRKPPRRPAAEQLSLKPPGELERKRAEALTDAVAALPPETLEQAAEREAHERAAMERAREALPFARAAR